MMTLRWLGMSIVVVIVFFGLLWLNALSKSQAREIALQVQEKQPKKPLEPRQEYVLEVIGLGVTLDKYRQGKLWRALQKGSPYTSIREQDPNKYPWTGDDKDGYGGSRAYDALENGINLSLSEILCERSHTIKFIPGKDTYDHRQSHTRQTA